VPPRTWPRWVAPAPVRSTGAMSGATILVVDDEEYIRDLVASALRLAGFDARSAATARDALATISADRADLVVLDVGMPDFDGYEVCRRMRRAGDQTPVIFLTARDAVDDRLTAFAHGADDYLTKPFSLEELVARVHAVLRRTTASSDGHRLRCADLELDEDSLRVARGGRPLQLSPTELKLLRFLLVNREQVVSRGQIVAAVWDDDIDPASGVVENYISYLRKKVDEGRPPLIHTVRGFGYVLRSDP
jgi:two-component system, OmpR family, response regulator